MRWRSLGAGLVVLGMSSGCAVSSPRFLSQDVQTAVAQSDMQRLETERLVLYYPRGTRESALHIAGRLEYCRRELEKRAAFSNDLTQEKAVFVLPSLAYNNAYVQPAFTQRQIGLVPQYNTAIDLFEQLNLPPDPGTIGCHEMVHDFHSRQVRGAARVIRHVLGNYYTPQQGLDSWFWEGLAVFYETRLSGLGRLNDAYFDGQFHAGFAGKTINGGDLSDLQRDTPFGAQYLVGSHFVDFLVRRYGEEKLWRLIKGTGNSIFFPIGINSAFRRAYDRSLSELIEDFDAEVKQRYPVRARPPTQTVARELPSTAVFARAPSGHSALATQGPDDYAQLAVYDPSGKELLAHRLNDLGFGRRIVGSSVGLISGLSFTADGQHLYFVIVDTGPVYSEAHLMHLDVARDELEIVEQNLEGAGGSVSADGKRYYYSHALGPSLALHVYDLKSHTVNQLTPAITGSYPSNPVVSPDGKRLLVTEAGDGGVRLALFDAHTGQRLSSVSTPPGIALHPSWLGDQRVLYSASDGRSLQAFETDLGAASFRQLTQAPYLAARPFSDGRTLHFLNREGWRWTLDRTPYPLPPRPQATPPAVPPEAAPVTPPAARLTHLPGALAGADVIDPSRLAAPPEIIRTLAVSANATPSKAPAFESTSYAHHQTPRDVPVKVISDHEYSASEALFVPDKWGPWLVSRANNGTAFGAFVTGKDILGFQSWLLSAAYDPKAKLPTVGVSYLNFFAAPWAISGDFSFIGRREAQTEDLVPQVNVPVRIRETIADLTISRSWYDTTGLGFGARYIDSNYQLESPRFNIAQQRFVGPLATLSYRTFDGTSYAGRKLGVSFTGMGTLFPRQLSTASFDVTDARGELGAALPLPISKRHKLELTMVGRGLLGSPRDTPLLQVGGAGNANAFQNQNDNQPDTRLASGVLPVGLRFYEPLRGFEDLALFSRYLASGTATYTYPLIVDVGSATSLGFLPASFLRQIDLQLFGTGATFVDSGRSRASAVGAALLLRTNLWVLPLTFTFQEARRLSNDERFAFFFGLSAD